MDNSTTRVLAASQALASKKPLTDRDLDQVSGGTMKWNDPKLSGNIASDEGSWVQD
ncbi:hypothetical protein [Sphingomonas oryzagri]